MNANEREEKKARARSTGMKQTSTNPEKFRA